LTKNEIRTHYSGFILFAAKLATVATGLGFTLLVARAVTQIEYGVWGTLNIILPYFLMMANALPFWVLRFVARDQEGSVKTGVLANTLISMLASLLYFALFRVFIPSFRLEAYVWVFIIAAAQIIEFYVITVLEACLQAKRPYTVGYGLLVGEVAKLALAYFLIGTLQLALLGAILSITIAFALKLLFYFGTMAAQLRGKIVVKYIKEWFKGSTFNIYSIVGDRVAAIIFLMLPIFGGEIAASYYQAAAPIANIIAYSQFLAFALYPSLLAKVNTKDVTASLRMVLMFAIPMTAGVVAMPVSYLIILKDIYVEATPVLIVLAIDAFVLTMSTVFHAVFFGVERIDEKATVPFKGIAQSRVFIAFSIPYLHSMITLPPAYFILTNFAKDPIQVASYAMTINMVGHIIMFLVLYALVRKRVKVEIPWKNIAKYVLASLPMAAVLFFTHPTRISLTLGVTALGGAIYTGLLLVIDRDTRALVQMILRELGKSIDRYAKVLWKYCPLWAQLILRELERSLSARKPKTKQEQGAKP